MHLFNYLHSLICHVWIDYWVNRTLLFSHAFSVSSIARHSGSLWRHLHCYALHLPCFDVRRPPQGTSPPTAVIPAGWLSPWRLFLLIQILDRPFWSHSDSNLRKSVMHIYRKSPWNVHINVQGMPPKKCGQNAKRSHRFGLLVSTLLYVITARCFMQSYLGGSPKTSNRTIVHMILNVKHGPWLH